MSGTGSQGQTMARPEQPPQSLGLGHKPQQSVFMWLHFGGIIKHHAVVKRALYSFLWYDGNIN